MTSITLDEKDFQILKVLQEHARLSVREVAGRVHLSPTPTYERIRRMEQQGIIRQYGALLDAKKIGKGITVICQVTLREHNKKAGQQFIKAIMAMPEVVECYNIAGDFDFQLRILTATMESYHQFFVNKLSEVPFIGQMKSIFVMDVIKQTHIIV